MPSERNLIKTLLALTILLGVATILTIRTIVPSFVVEGATIILVVYVVILILLQWRWSGVLLIVLIILSIFTISAVFSSTQHIELIEEGYLPAIIIIFSGLVLEAALLVSSIYAIWKGPKLALR